jgi:hypothetical protein
MKNLILTSVLVLISLISFSQIKESGVVSVTFEFDGTLGPECVTYFKDSKNNSYQFYNADLGVFSDGGCGISSEYVDKEFVITYSTETIMLYGEGERPEEYEGLVIKKIELK